MSTATAVLFLLLLTNPGTPQDITPTDSDGDGLSDKFENELLNRFVPQFAINTGECDGFPAEFTSGSSEPQPLARNATIYGQVFPAASLGRAGSWIEIHYYHLWSRDCGANGHELDAEHVSALLVAPSISVAAPDWKAVYWYAAAHKDTVCDAGQGARAGALGAEDLGPMVWISGGKHASFLSLNACRGGCGGDSCDQMVHLKPAKLINLGEPFSPMNGALWIGSSRWNLSAKMQTDFPESVRAQLETSKGPSPVPLNGSPDAVKAVVLAGGATADALAVADRKTDSALSSADDHADKAVEGAAKTVGRTMKRAGRGFLNFLRGPKP